MNTDETRRFACWGSLGIQCECMEAAALVLVCSTCTRTERWAAHKPLTPTR